MAENEEPKGIGWQLASVTAWGLEVAIPLVAFAHLGDFVKEPALGLLQGILSAATLIFWFYLYANRSLGGIGAVQQIWKSFFGPRN